MNSQSTNEQRTDDYLKKFDREKVLKLLLSNDSPVIFDIGANTGSSLVEFKSWWPNATVHCFEPQQECWAELENKSENYSKGSVYVNRVGAGDQECREKIFYTHELTTGQSGFNKINTKSIDSINLQQMKKTKLVMEKYESYLNHERSVPIVRLDNYIENNEILKINLMKIDTQGYEPEVLSGLGNKLGAIDVVITELMFYDFYERSLTFSDIEKYLLPAGFRLYDISHISKNPMNGRTDWIDVIYVNENLRKVQLHA